MRNKILRQAKVIQNESGQVDAVVYANITFLAAGNEAEQLETCWQYDYHIIDFGQADCVGEYELNRCDRCFLIGDLSLWNVEGSIKAACLFKKRYVKDARFLFTFYSKEGINAYKKAVKEPPVIIPVDMEPFSISKDTLIFMEKLFGEEVCGKAVK